MVKTIKTDGGFTCQVDDEILQDMEFLDILREVSSGKVTAMSDYVDFFFGDQKKAAYDFCRNSAGHVTVADVANLITEIIQKLGGKN